LRNVKLGGFKTLTRFPFLPSLIAGRDKKKSLSEEHKRAINIGEMALRADSIDSSALVKAAAASLPSSPRWKQIKCEKPNIKSALMACNCGAQQTSAASAIVRTAELPKEDLHASPRKDKKARAQEQSDSNHAHYANELLIKARLFPFRCREMRKRRMRVRDDIKAKKHRQSRRKPWDISFVSPQLRAAQPPHSWPWCIFFPASENPHVICVIEAGKKSVGELRTVPNS
jgi:hypothetical protein